MDENTLSITLAPVAESLKQATFAVLVGWSVDTARAVERAGEPLSEEAAREQPGFSHFFTWDYRDVEQQLRPGKRGQRRQQAVGKFLYNSVFTQRARQELSERLDGAAGGALYLRLILGSPRLQMAPWEWMYSPADGGYLALRPGVHLARLEPHQLPWEPLLVVPPLKVLLVDCRGAGPRAQKGTDRETVSLLNNDAVEVTATRYTNRAELAQQLIVGGYHAVHLLGPLERTGDEAYLTVREGGLWSVLSTPAIATLIRGSYVRLLAVTPSKPTHQVGVVNFLGARVRELGVPAVLTSGPDPDGSYLDWLADHFYPALAPTGSVEQALAVTRSLPDSGEQSLSLALFLGTPSSQLYDLAKQAPSSPGDVAALQSRQLVKGLIHQVASTLGSGAMGTGNIVVGEAAEALLNSGTLERYLEQTDALLLDESSRRELSEDASRENPS